MRSKARIVYLDQNAWISLAKGSWDKERYPREHEALTKVVELVRSGSIIVPLTFANIYETSKINVRHQRINIARAQSLISKGIVFRSRRRILTETLAAYLATRFGISHPNPPEHWFLSHFWFEATGDYSPVSYGVEISERLLDLFRENPDRALFDFLAFSEEKVRREAVRSFTVGSAELIQRRVSALPPSLWP